MKTKKLEYTSIEDVKFLVETKKIETVTGLIF
jgi:hypothetical protein